MKAYLDTNIFIFGITDPVSESATILECAGIKFIPVISEYTIEEVVNWFKNRKGRLAADDVYHLMHKIPKLELVYAVSYRSLEREYRSTMDDCDDVLHVCAYIVSDAEYFVTANRKLAQERIKDKINFTSPEEFVKTLEVVKCQ